MVRFEQFEISLINKENDIIGKNVHEDVPAKVWIDLNSVVAFREEFEDNESENLGEATIVYLKSGETFWLKIPFIKFKSKYF